MRDSLIEIMTRVTPEEQSYLDGNTTVIEDIYSKGQMGEIDCELLLKEGRLITARPHSRFIDFPPHRHNYIEIMYVCQGSITHIIDGKDIVMKRGDMLFMNPFVTHSIRKAGMDDIGINFIALPEFFDIPLRMIGRENILASFVTNTIRNDNGESEYLLFKLGKLAEVENLIENLVSSMIEGLSGDGDEDEIINQYSMGLVFLLILYNMDRLNKDSSISFEEIVTQAVLSYINTDYRDANLTKVATDLHQPLSGLSKLIKKTTGYTFQELLQKKRFHRAVVLLMESDMSIEQVAVEVGYENFSYFYRQFQKKYGLTPRKYRLKYQNQPSVPL